MTVKHKIHDVPDEVCEGCPQNYMGECEAFLVAHSQDEYEYRIRKLPDGRLMRCDTYAKA